MNLKGLAKVKADAERMQEIVNDKIDDLDPDVYNYDEQTEYLEAAWMLLDEIIDNFKELQDIKLEHYL